MKPAAMTIIARSGAFSAYPEEAVVTTQATSFMTTARTKRGRYIGANHFDVPPMEYGEGRLHGYRCMLELLDVIRSDEALLQGERKLHDGDVFQALVDAAAAEAQRDFQHPHPGNAAVTFLQTTVQALRFLARQANYRHWLEAKIKSEQEGVEYVAQRDAKAKAEFVQRMKDAKAKKARRAALDNRKAPKSTRAEVPA